MNQENQKESTLPKSRHRRCIVLQGDHASILESAASLTSRLHDVLHIGPGKTPFHQVRRLLGQAFDAVILDFFDGLDADVLGQCHGLVRGGGALLLLLPQGHPPPPTSFAIFPFRLEDITSHFYKRMHRFLPLPDAHLHPLSAPARVFLGTDEQHRVAEAMAGLLSSSPPRVMVLMADRGRGKSSALGLALRKVMKTSSLRVVVTGPSPQAAAEVFRFANSPDLRFFEPIELAKTATPTDVIIVDEAAQLPVALLRRIVSLHPDSHIAFATTIHGYEGTGRGFALRFVDWLETQPRPIVHFTLTQPIRWDNDDPLERIVFDILALDARVRSHPCLPSSPVATVLDRGLLSRDETLLQSLFALLVQGHYRTTPSDFHRLLDAPNLAIHAVVEGHDVLAATLVGHEGGLDQDTCEAMAKGEFRVHGHALADTLITHGGRPDAGELSMLRSIRIVTHPHLRNRGLAKRLIDHVHQTYEPDLFGTIFGATPELIAFRRSVGYQLVRFGASRGHRTGEPAAVMLHPRSRSAEQLVRFLRLELARNLPIQLALLEAEGLGLEAALAFSLFQDLEAAEELAPSEIQKRVSHYVNGPQTFDSAAYCVLRFVRDNDSLLSVLGAKQRSLVENRVIHLRSWSISAVNSGYLSIPEAMRAFRPAIRKMLYAKG